MIKIAIVEDGNEEAKALISCLTRYSKENNLWFEFTRYGDANSFLEERGKTFDIVFMDIMLPGINGMEAAFRLRKYNTRTILIFVTNMTNFAIKSYEVDALDYIVKPITYERVVFKLQKALQIVDANEGEMVIIRNAQNSVTVSTDQIYYIEVKKHRLTYHTEVGVFENNGSLSELEEQFTAYNFSRCTLAISSI